MPPAAGRTSERTPERTRSDDRRSHHVRMSTLSSELGGSPTQHPRLEPENEREKEPAATPHDWQTRRPGCRRCAASSIPRRGQPTPRRETGTWARRNRPQSSPSGTARIRGRRAASSCRDVSLIMMSTAMPRIQSRYLRRPVASLLVRGSRVGQAPGVTVYFTVRGISCRIECQTEQTFSRDNSIARSMLAAGTSPVIV